MGSDFTCASPRKIPFKCDSSLSLGGAEIHGTLELQGTRLNDPGHRNHRGAFSDEQLKGGVESVFPPADEGKDEVRVAVDLNQLRTQALLLEAVP